MSETILRPATRADSFDIAKLFLVSSDGLAAYIWSRMEGPGLSLEEIGARRYAREGVAFSYENCRVVERDGRILGMLHSFAMDPPGDDAEEESDPVLRPYAELEDHGSLYISGIALLPEARGSGLGTRLMAAAEMRARSLGLKRLSLICFEMNQGALRLYRRLGYRETDSRALVPHPTLKYAEGDALLMVKVIA